MIVNLLAKQNVHVDNLVTIATPERGYQLETYVGQHINVYNNQDIVQSDLGGSIWTLGYTFTRKFKNA
jgi:hypothetical protein